MVDEKLNLAWPGEGKSSDYAPPQEAQFGTRERYPQRGGTSTDSFHYAESPMQWGFRTSG